MSAGNRILTFRMTEEMITAIEADIEARNEVTRRAQWTVSDYIRQAIADKLDHARRSRTRRPRADQTAEG